MTAAHSRLPPSDSAYWVKCTGRLQLGEQFPALTVDPSAAEGEAAHWVAYSMIRTHIPSVGDVAPNGLLVDEEMLEGGRVYHQSIFSVANPHSAMSRVSLETRRTMPSLHPEMFGTSDADLDLIAQAAELHFWDYKYGHEEVDEYQNWQLASYARGKLDELGLDGLAEQHVTLVFHIVQPRCYSASGPVRTWRIKAADMRATWNVLSAAAHEALGPNPRYAVGPQCKRCAGRRACPTLRRNAGGAMDLAGLGMPQQLDGLALGIDLAMAERSLALLSARVEALREQASHMLQQRLIVPGYEMGRGRGANIWDPEISVDQVLGLGMLLGLDFAKERAAITPAQAKEMAKRKGVDGSVIAEYSKHVPGAAKLQAVPETAIERVFTQ